MIVASTIYLVEPATGQQVQADLLDGIEAAQLADWDGAWRPARDALKQSLITHGVPLNKWPESLHWDWPKKTARVQGLLGFRGFSVIANGMTQGLEQCDLTKSARDRGQQGKPIVYVDYLEVAPWNWPLPFQQPRYKGVGVALLAAAVQLSLDEGFKGRIGLHSLPQAEDFYRRFNMIDLGPDSKLHDLRYFEMNADGARAFLNEE